MKDTWTHGELLIQISRCLHGKGLDPPPRLITGVDIFPSFITDYSPIYLTIQFHCNPKGRGYWKFNDSLLDDQNFVEQVKERVEQIKRSNQMLNS